jgi:hypothetical protein
MRTVGDLLIPVRRDLNVAYVALGASVWLLAAGLNWPYVPFIGWLFFAAGCLGFVRSYLFGEREDNAAGGQSR